jgi:hypothetical protein
MSLIHPSQGLPSWATDGGVRSGASVSTHAPQKSQNPMPNAKNADQEGVPIEGSAGGAPVAGEAAGAGAATEGAGAAGAGAAGGAELADVALLAAL